MRRREHNSTQKGILKLIVHFRVLVERSLSAHTPIYILTSAPPYYHILPNALASELIASELMKPKIRHIINLNFMHPLSSWEVKNHELLRMGEQILCFTVSFFHSKPSTHCNRKPIVVTYTQTRKPLHVICALRTILLPY